MDSTETPILASEKKQTYMNKYSLLPERWHFLTGEKSDILSLSQQVGFRFRWDDQQKIFAHLPVAYVLTPKGQISRYLYGVEYSPQTLKLALVEASQNQIGTIMDKILLFCFQFDPHRGRYSWYAYNIYESRWYTHHLFAPWIFATCMDERKKKYSKKELVSRVKYVSQSFKNKVASSSRNSTR